MGSGSSGLSKGGGGSGGGSTQQQGVIQGSNGIFSTKDLSAMAGEYDKYKKAAEDRLANNPNNMTYREMRDNYDKLSKVARNMDATATSYTGLEAIVALEMASKIGNEVDISGTIFPGTYKFQNITAWGMPGKAWVQQGGNRHSFGYNTSTIASELGMVSGGLFTSNTQRGKNVKVVLR